MDIAVIGGGIAGLTAAHALARGGRHRVTLFERASAPGFTAASVSVPGPQGAVRVDVPLRVFYPGYYPTLTRLYAELGVASEPVNYATTLFDDQGRRSFRWHNLRWGRWSVPVVWPHEWLHGGTREVVRGALAFRRLAAALLAAEAAGRPSAGTLGQWLAQPTQRTLLGPRFVHGLLLPTLATVATCTYEDGLAYPVEVVAAYLAAGVSHQSVRRAVQGADEVAARLLAPVHRVVLEAGVTGVREAPAALPPAPGGSGGHHPGPAPAESAGVWVERSGAPPERFDHVVLATQANQALALWHSATARERAVLQAFPYRALEVTVHRDPSLMPPRRRDWSAVNARVCPRQDRPQTTIWVNRVQPALAAAEPVFQTVHPHQSPREALVLGRAHFERPLVHAGTAAALQALQALQDEPPRRVWLCGSYARPGVPLLESAVVSALGVAQRLG